MSAFELGVRVLSSSQFDFGGMRFHSFLSLALSSAKRSSSSSSVNAGPCILARCEARSVRMESSGTVARGGMRTENLCVSEGNKTIPYVHMQTRCDAWYSFFFISIFRAIITCGFRQSGRLLAFAFARIEPLFRYPGRFLPEETVHLLLET